MSKINFMEFWNAFVCWKGWKAFAGFWVKAWKMNLRWGVWKVVFGLPFLLVLAMSIGCGAALVWVFIQGKEQWFGAYFLYGLSAYCMMALCVQLPCALRNGKVWLSGHPKLEGMLKNKDMKFKLQLYFQQIINFAYGIFKILAGVVIGSAWIGCDGIYNLTQALIQLFQILRRKKAATLIQQWKSYRFCGVLMLLMHLTLTGIVFQMVNWNRAEEQGEILVIATAAFAFYKFVSSFVELAKDRKHTHPVDSSVRMLELSQAVFAIFSLQASMFHTFGTGESWEHWLNLGTGCTVCLLVVSMGIYMIRRGNREIRTLQERSYGE